MQVPSSMAVRATVAQPRMRDSMPGVATLIVSWARLMVVTSRVMPETRLTEEVGAREVAS